MAIKEQLQVGKDPFKSRQLQKEDLKLRRQLACLRKLTSEKQRKTRMTNYKMFERPKYVAMSQACD
jgi:hypothetical protein